MPDAPLADVLEVAFHRTMKSHWKSIAKKTDSGRWGLDEFWPCPYVLSEKRFGADGYRSGLRGKYPTEIKVAIRQAVQAGVIFSKPPMDRLMTAEKVPSQVNVSVYDTMSDTMLWSRAGSNLGSSSWTETTPAVNLVAREDRDLGDEEDATSSGQPDTPPVDTRGTPDSVEGITKSNKANGRPHGRAVCS